MGSRLFLEDQNTDCTLIPNPIDLRGWVSCTQFQQNSLTSGHVFGHGCIFLIDPENLKLVKGVVRKQKMLMWCRAKVWDDFV